MTLIKKNSPNQRCRKKILVGINQKMVLANDNLKTSSRKKKKTLDNINLKNNPY